MVPAQMRWASTWTWCAWRRPAWLRSWRRRVPQGPACRQRLDACKIVAWLQKPVQMPSARYADYLRRNAKHVLHHIMLHTGPCYVTGSDSAQV